LIIFGARKQRSLARLDLYVVYTTTYAPSGAVLKYLELVPPAHRQRLSPTRASRRYDPDQYPEGIFDCITSPTDPSSLASYECIYGIPECLLAMQEDATRVIVRVEEARSLSDFTSLPEELIATCDVSEQSILDCSPSGRPSSTSDTDNVPNVQMIHHHSVSFHSALVIYFSQNVGQLDHRYLRPYVGTVLQSIEAIEQIKSETNILAAPLFWPTFIAATEAHQQDHQARFRAWYDQVNSYGIASVRTGTRVIYEVWKQGPARVQSARSPQRQIVALSGRDLMLS
jgi:arginine metabolism regulation protein II